MKNRLRPLRAKTVRSSSFEKILDEAREKGVAEVLSYIMLRSLMKARYSNIPAPHFGLAIEKYCHFTSPIRRYPDLSVHRILKAVLHGKAEEAHVRRLSEFAALSAKQSSDCELKALYAERDIEDLYKALYMKEKIGEEYTGTVSSVCNFGFFVTLDNTCEGLVPVTSLNGYFDYSEEKHTLSRGTVSYTLGDKVQILVEAVDIQSGKTEFRLIPHK